MKYTSEDLAVMRGGKRSEASRRRGVVLDAVRAAKVTAAKRGQSHAAQLLGIAGMALTDEALIAVYEAVAADAARA